MERTSIEFRGWAPHDQPDSCPPHESSASEILTCFNCEGISHWSATYCRKFSVFCPKRRVSDLLGVQSLLQASVTSVEIVIRIWIQICRAQKSPSPPLSSPFFSSLLRSPFFSSLPFPSLLFSSFLFSSSQFYKYLSLFSGKLVLAGSLAGRSRVFPGRLSIFPMEQWTFRGSLLLACEKRRAARAAPLIPSERMNILEKHHILFHFSFIFFHCLSFFLIFSHFLSLSVIFSHFLSFFMFFSFAVIFSHFLSCSVIFCHCFFLPFLLFFSSSSSCSLVLKVLFFFCLDCLTISY